MSCVGMPQEQLPYIPPPFWLDVSQTGEFHQFLLVSWDSESRSSSFCYQIVVRGDRKSTATPFFLASSGMAAGSWARRALSLRLLQGRVGNESACRKLSPRLASTLGAYPGGEETLVAEARYVPNTQFLSIPFRSELIHSAA